MSDKIKQDAATTASNSKLIIELLKNKCVGSVVSTIWENKKLCADYYRCDTSLFYCQFYRNCIINVLIMISVQQDMEDRLYMALMLYTKASYFI